MDKLAYHYNKKKLPAKTEGKYLYYYPCADLEYANIQMGGRGFVTVEVTEQEWDALLELDRIEYNNQHKFARHTTPMPNGEDDSLPIKQQEQLHTKDVSIPTATADKFDKQTRFNQLSDRDKKIISLLEEVGFPNGKPNKNRNEVA